MNTTVGGKLVKVKDGNMHIKQMGQGEKTIVYLPGWNEPLPTVESVPLMRELAKRYTVCVIEYFGYGFSDSTEREHTNENYVQEIREALTMAGLKPPYILMPYSCSGIYSEYYAGKYPNEIEGIIMLDCTSTAEELAVDELVDEEKVQEALNDLIANGTGVPTVESEQWEMFCKEHFSEYYAEYLSQGYTKEELDEEVQDILNTLTTTADDISDVEPEALEAHYAEFLPQGYTKEELDVQAKTPNHADTLKAQDKALADNVKEVISITSKVANEIPVLVFNSEPVDDEHRSTIDDHLEKLGKVKKHVIIRGSDHSNITFYRDIISKEVDEFLNQI